MSALDLSLFDVENVEQMPKVRDMEVRGASTRDVQEFARRYHYTATGGNMTWRWGLWHGVTLLGVVAYNLPTRETCASVFGPEQVAGVWHMGRLALAEDAPHNSESRLIGGSLRAIHRDHPHVWGVLTFAAIDAGHLGYVYQATNALYTGTGGHSVVYVDERGQRRSDYYASAYVSATQARERGWTVTEGAAKHRYVYVLGTAKQRRHRLAQLRLPNPKAPQPPGGEPSSSSPTTAPVAVARLPVPPP